ncbi:MAG TPA: SIMPL domain-containing protein, partial [Gemmatimonadaceae bacterium]|nr:SIMPL domain-containing protein [Gemmatimonadaceae bacterium]
MQPTARLLPAAAILGGALALSALFVAVGLGRVRPDVHAVTVKGVAEREVRADLAIWPLNVSAADDDLGRAQARLEQSIGAIRAFLVRHRVDTTQLSLQAFVVSDAYANQYGGGGEVRTRYVIRQTVVVRSSDPQRVLAASQRVGELVNAGVVLTSGGEYGTGGPTFLFTGLNALKPPMIAEATARAREAAEQFARDARQDLAGIRRASQGVFEILPRDQAPGISEGSQLLKTVRVVSTI